ncbi:MAG: hypothetical protein ACP5QR_05080 [Rhizomicrobium sp.]
MENVFPPHSDMFTALAGIAKAAAQVHQLKFAEDALLDAADALGAALVQVDPSGDQIIVEHMRTAKERIDYALAQVRAAQ